ncbi:MAG TPA: serine/threonine-protein kinase, partial [Steroidobacteraceae bacterium]|nr:serine/threonine-protein kinase [Steroidobacteraceae bacterium]
MNNSNASNEGPSGRLDAELDRLLDLPLEQREHALRHDYPDEPALRAELESLLRSAAEMGQFLAQPAQPTTDGEAPRMSAGPLRLGAWRLIRRIGSGGMGEVFEARRADGGFEQRAAVKLLQVGAVGLHERFHAERRILARLEHPGIARLLDGGVAEDGRPWMAMEFVEGTAITAHCREVQASLGERLRLFQQICEAVAYAHRNLIVHRDLKPANILVDGERRVRLLDFGIAKLLDDEAAAIRTAAAPLTPAYAAPEQLRGGAVTTATDVYALGLLLFELLAGCRPWAQDHSPVADTLRAILEKPAPAASTVAAANPDAPLPARVLRGDLDAILAKALREEPAQRYATVDALKLDIERVQRGEAVAAREGARLYRLAHFVRRNRWALTAAAAVFVSLAIGLGATAWQAHRASIQRDIARRDLAREEALR